MPSRASLAAASHWAAALAASAVFSAADVVKELNPVVAVPRLMLYRVQPHEPLQQKPSPLRYSPRSPSATSSAKQTGSLRRFAVS